MAIKSWLTAKLQKHQPLNSAVNPSLCTARTRTRYTEYKVDHLVGINSNRQTKKHHLDQERLCGEDDEGKHLDY